MSDLLLMANSPLRYLLSIPGTVALYDPYRDVYGKAHSTATTKVNSSWVDYALVRNNGATYGFVRSNGTSWPAGTVVSARALVAKKEYGFAILGQGNRSSDVMIVINLDTGAFTTSAPSGDIALVSAGVTYRSDLDAWEALIVGRQLGQFVQYAWVTGSPDGTYGFTGDGVSGIYMYGAQCGYGDAPFGAPSIGKPQILTNFSGTGNHAQLGSTSGADTNDPSQTHVSNYFDGVDDVYSNWPDAEYELHAWGSAINSFGWVSAVPTETLGHYFGGILLNRTPGEGEEARIKGAMRALLASRGVALA